MAAQLLRPYAKRAYNRARRPMIKSVQLLQFMAVQKDTGLAVRMRLKQKLPRLSDRTVAVPKLYLWPVANCLF